ncbi:MAG: hypothetical protein OXU21_13600, partial [Chloroflexota bacterium]|nr:hypothetical protein [Chloroflexota bacterium]
SFETIRETRGQMICETTSGVQFGRRTTSKTRITLYAWTNGASGGSVEAKLLSRRPTGQRLGGPELDSEIVHEGIAQRPTWPCNTSARRSRLSISSGL